MLSVSQLTKTFYPGIFARLYGAQPFHAVKEISFEVEKGEIVGLLGPNGAGKTTTLYMLLGVLNPTSGSVVYFGNDLFQYRSHVMQKVGFASTYLQLPEHITVEENLDVYGRLYSLPASERAKNIDRLLHQFGMHTHRKKLMGTLSAGQKTRIMLAKAFIADPWIVLLDEPTAALDPDIAHDLRHFILEQQHSRGIAILLASHNMQEVTEMCNRVLVLQQGVIIDHDSPQNLAARMRKCRLGLLVTDIKKTVALANELGLMNCVEEQFVVIELDEQYIASFLQHLARHQVEYSQIYIDKPSLEDYFLAIARGKTI